MEDEAGIGAAPLVDRLLVVVVRLEQLGDLPRTITTAITASVLPAVTRNAFVRPEGMWMA